MQKLLLLDYLDGTKKPKSTFWVTMVKFMRTAITATPKGFNGLNIAFGKELHSDEVNTLKGLVGRDASFCALYACYGKLQREEGNNSYIFSKGLMEALASAVPDVKSSYLPKKFCGYLELPGLRDKDGDLIYGIIIDIDSVDGVHYFKCSYVTSIHDFVISHWHFKINPEISLETQIEELSHTETLIENGKLTTAVTEGILHNSMGIIANAVLYLGSGESDIKKTVNEFSKKKSKLVTQEKLFTKKDYFIVGGEDFCDYKKVHLTDISVRSHWRWQPYGPKRSKVKFILINSYEYTKETLKH